MSAQAQPAGATALWHTITLHLAREAAFPNGSEKHGYTIHAPLDAALHLDAAAWRQSGLTCKVTRFWGTEPSRAGWLEHRRGGADGATWVIDYDRSSAADDEPAYRLDRHHFKLGEYVTIAGHDRSHTFVVARLVATPPPAAS